MDHNPETKFLYSKGVCVNTGLIWFILRTENIESVEVEADGANGTYKNWTKTLQ